MEIQNNGLDQLAIREYMGRLKQIRETFRKQAKKPTSQRNYVAVDWAIKLVSAVIEHPQTESAPVWIPCSEQLPPVNSIVLACPVRSKNRYELMIMTYEIDGNYDEQPHMCWKNVEDSICYDTDEVAAWMELPDVYKDDEQQGES